ncbi:MAG: nucleotide exchange factor GrpE [Bacteroidales bacterium]|nr:nucleotide exchange factor GrpE [Bacteroidales bacterium]
MNNQEEKLEEQQKPEQDVQTETTEAQAQEQPAEEVKEVTPEEQIEELQKQLAAQKDAYLRLMADFDNFRKNTLRDKQNLLKYGGEDAFKKLLPVIDDFERAIDHMEKSDDINSLREGVNLIYSKFKTYLEQNELTVIPAEMGETFDENIHDAMTLFPAPTPELKGKIVDCVTKGYKLKDKVIRFAKVVVGQ